MRRRLLVLLVVFPIWSVLIVDQSLCISCGADELFTRQSPSMSNFQRDVSGDPEEPKRGPEESASDPACPLCVSRHFSLSAELSVAPPVEVLFHQKVASWRELKNCSSIFHPPRV